MWERNLANKPMVPTAPTLPINYPLAPPRRHIGRPLGGFNGQRPGDRDVGPRMMSEGQAPR